MPRVVEQVGGALRRAASVVRRVVGVPDYERYLAHFRERHPGQTPLTLAEFERDRIENKYSKPGARCC